jgi:hypothetical protein
VTGAQRLPDWEQLSTAVPDIVTPMRRYLQQLTAILRPGSVSNADQALRSLAAFLTEQAPEVRFVADIRRRHIEDFRTWLAVIEELAQLGVQLLIQTGLEAEMDEFLGRDRYQRAAGVADARPGMRNGYQPITVKTTAGSPFLPETSSRERVGVAAVDKLSVVKIHCDCAFCGSWQPGVTWRAGLCCVPSVGGARCWFR